MKRFLSRLSRLFQRQKLDRDMADEMSFHLEERALDHVDGGMAPAEADYAARRKFGNVGVHQEIARSQRPLVWIDQLVQDLRYAARQLQRNPGFAATAIAILGLGIGATTAMFSVVNSIVLKPLPYDQPGQLVQVFEAPRPQQQNNVSPGIFLDWREQTTHFEALAAYSGVQRNFSGDGTPERINGLRMSASALPLLRARPLLGRLFTAEEEQMGNDKVIILTNQLWQRRFAGDQSIVGRSIGFNDERYTVVGVLPDRFLPFASQEYIIPLAIDPRRREERGSHELRVLGRLKPGAALAQAQSELDAIALRSKPLYPAWKRDWGITVMPMQEQMVQSMKPALLILLGAVGLVLLIACTNVANLLLAKATARQKEIALRAALGAGRGRIIRQLLAESVFLSTLGAGLGLLLAVWSVSGLRHLLTELNQPRAHEVALDPTVLSLALAASLVTGVIFGLVPALQASRPVLNHALKDATRGSAAGGNRLRGALIVGEVALALVLLVGAGLTLHSFYRLMNVPPGFNPEGALTLQISLSRQRYPDTPKRAAFYNQVAEKLAALPGVEAAGVAQSLPMRGVSDVFFRIVGRADQPEQGYDADIDFCTPDYFRAMGITLLRGRPFTAHEAATGARVAIINATFAKDHFAGVDPIGQQLERDDKPWEIIGIAGDVRMRGLNQPIRAMVYRPQTYGDTQWNSAGIAIRTRQPPASLAEPARRAIAELDGSLPVASVVPLEEIVADSLASRKLGLVFLGGFAVVALVLAAIGLYGVIAYTVTQRTREFGIRVALGATRGAVLSLVLGQSLRLVALGLVIGLAGSLALTQVLTNLLFEVKPTDPLTLSVVSALLFFTALVSAWLPARRAAKVDPIVALRCE